MIISKPELIPQNGDLRFCVRVHFSGESKTLWYRLSEEYTDMVSDRSDAPLVALLIPAMLRGEDIHIEGTISEKLFYNISGPYQKVLKLIIPSLHLVNIIPTDVQPAHSIGEGVAMGFSAGIDSFCVLADHHYADGPKGFKVTHLLFNNVGSHGSGENGTHLFHKRHNRIRPIASRIGLPFIAIDTNMDSFYQGLDFQLTHTPRNASIALLLQREIKRFYYASSFHYSNAFIGPSYDMAYSDTITLPLLSTETLEMISTGSEYTRVEKTLKVAKIEDSYRALDICVRGDTQNMINCSTCWKCKRTMLTLEIAGELDRYSGVFDLDAYRRIQDLYIGEVLCSKDPLLREIASFIKNSGFKVPLSSRLYAYTRLFFIAKQVKRVIRKPYKIARKLRERI